MEHSGRIDISIIDLDLKQPASIVDVRPHVGIGRGSLGHHGDSPGAPVCRNGSLQDDAQGAPEGRVHELARALAGDKLRVGIRKGLFSLPEHAHTSVICVGPGTGIAPRRALIEERVFAGSTEKTLYFGCRLAKNDQHYCSEWEAHVWRELTYRVIYSRNGLPGGRSDVCAFDRETRPTMVCGDGNVRRRFYLLAWVVSNAPRRIHRQTQKFGNVDGLREHCTTREGFRCRTHLPTVQGDGTIHGPRKHQEGG
ncbi:hypothetical protein BKA93DRAFT_487479 [Sparassis latifolia]